MKRARRLQVIVLTVGLVTLLIGLVALLPLGGFGPTFAETSERSFGATATEIDVRSFNGPVTYEPWDENFIQVETTIRVTALTTAMAEGFADAVDLRFEETGGRIRAEAQWQGGLFGRGNVIVAFIVRIPTDWIGDVVLTTRNGPIRARDVMGDGVFRTSNGAIEVDGSEGSLDLRTSNGRITVTDVHGGLAAHTSNGGVRVEGGVLSNTGFIRTSNGAVTVSTQLAEGADYDITTSNGSVTVSLVRPDVALQLRTSNGRIDLQTDVTVSRLERSRVEGRIGSGTARLHVRTSNGSITLDERAEGR